MWAYSLTKEAALTNAKGKDFEQSVWENWPITWEDSSKTFASPRIYSPSYPWIHFLQFVTSGQLKSENIKWKIPEIIDTF